MNRNKKDNRFNLNEVGLCLRMQCIECTTRMPCIHSMISPDVVWLHASHFLQLLCTENASNVLFASTKMIVRQQFNQVKNSIIQYI